MAYDIRVLLGVSLPVLVLGRSGRRIARQEGLILPGLCVAHVWAILPASEPA